jgi:2-polyprenyl-3-methyl-5-hydroxy-6-metoxy-1,4-benzoquinol methylase
MLRVLVCPVCRSPDLSRWGEKSAHQLYRCPKCTHVFADVRGSPVDYSKPEEFRERFTHGTMESDLAYYQHLRAGEVPGAQTFITTQLILRDLDRDGFRPGSTWLDIGCGSGYLVGEVQKRGLHAMGIEPGGWGQNAAREKGIKVLQGILTASTFSKKFDFVSATDVLEHQSDPHDMIGLFRHYLARAGRAYISFPCSGSWRARFLRARWQMVFPPTHCSFFSRASFEHLLKSYNLTAKRFICYNSSGFPGMSWLGLTLDRANRLLNLLGMGDQALAVIEERDR